MIYPYVVSAYTNNVYGLMIMLIFSLLLTLGFVFEIGRGALKIQSRQSVELPNTSNNHVEFIGKTAGRLNSNKVNIYAAKKNYSTSPSSLETKKGL